MIRVLADILRESGKEKVTRIIIATLRVRNVYVNSNPVDCYYFKHAREMKIHLRKPEFRVAKIVDKTVEKLLVVP